MPSTSGHLASLSPELIFSTNTETQISRIWSKGDLYNFFSFGVTNVGTNMELGHSLTAKNLPQERCANHKKRMNVRRGRSTDISATIFICK